MTAPLFAAVVAPFVVALGVPDAGNLPVPSAPSLEDATCAAQQAVPQLVWTTCATKSDFSAGNLSVAGHANVAGSLFASELGAGAIDTAGALHAGSAAVDGTVTAARGTFSDRVHTNDLAVDGRTEIGALQIRVTNAPSCVEGALAIVLDPDGSDTLEACLRTAQGNVVWTPVALGGFTPTLTQPRP